MLSVKFDVMPNSALAAGFIIKPEPSLKLGKAERVCAEIQNAAIKFLWSNPFRDMTVNKLMAETSVGRSAFYYHFTDLHELMETLLNSLGSEIMEGASPWLTEDGDPVALLRASLAAEVKICFSRGPMLKAVSDAAGADARLESAWYGLLDRFDDAVSERISADQALGLVDSFDSRLVATALNHADTALYIRAFGRKPRSQPGPVFDAISRVWISTIYGKQWAEQSSSTLYREQGVQRK